MASACLRNPPFSPLGTSPCSFLYTGLPRVSQANPLHVNDVTFFVFRGHSCGQEKGCVAETKKKKKRHPGSTQLFRYGSWAVWGRLDTLETQDNPLLHSALYFPLQSVNDAPYMPALWKNQCDCLVSSPLSQLRMLLRQRCS